MNKNKKMVSISLFLLGGIFLAAPTSLAQDTSNWEIKFNPDCEGIFSNYDELVNKVTEASVCIDKMAELDGYIYFSKGGDYSTIHKFKTSEKEPSVFYRETGKTNIVIMNDGVVLIGHLQSKGSCEVYKDYQPFDRKPGSYYPGRKAKFYTYENGKKEVAYDGDTQLQVERCWRSG